MKRLVIFALVCALLLVSLLGCSKKSDADDGHKGLQRNNPSEKGRTLNDSSNASDNPRQNGGKSEEVTEDRDPGMDPEPLP